MILLELKQIVNVLGIMLSTETMKNRAELGVATHIQANNE